jgi:hypothetical protein
MSDNKYDGVRNVKNKESKPPLGHSCCPFPRLLLASGLLRSGQLSSSSNRIDDIYASTRRRLLPRLGLLAPPSGLGVVDQPKLVNAYGVHRCSLGRLGLVHPDEV